MSATSARVHNNSANEDQVTGRIADAAHDAVDRAAEKAGRAESFVREAAADSAETLKENTAAAKEEIQKSVEKVGSYARENPIAAAGMAFVAGIVLSAVLRR